MKNIISFCVAAACSVGVASAGTLTVEPSPPGLQQSQQGPCIIGENSGTGIVQATSCDVVMPSNMADISIQSLEYTVSQIVDAVGAAFGIGIDVNEANTLQYMDSFNMEVSTDGGMTWSVVDSTNQQWALDDSVNNGNGISDLIIMSFNLAAYAANDLVRFNVDLSGLNDGREQFLLIDLAEVPLPGAIWLMGAGLAGLGFAGRKKKKVA